MIVVTAGQRDAASDAVGPRVDGGDFVARLDVGEDVAGYGVVLNVAGLTAKRYRCDSFTSGIEDDLRTA